MSIFQISRLYEIRYTFTSLFPAVSSLLTALYSSGNRDRQVDAPESYLQSSVMLHDYIRDSEAGFPDEGKPCPDLI
jgi:hypothetical protein